MVQVTLCVVLKAELFPVTISDDAWIYQTFQYLTSEFFATRNIIGRSSLDQYE